MTLIQRFGSAEQRSAQALVQRVAERIGSALERQGLLVQDCEQSYLALDPGKGEPVGDLLGHSITYRVEMRPRTGQKVFTPGACRRGRSESTTSPLPKRPASHCTRA